MTKQVDRSLLIDQLEELKQELSNILAQQEDPAPCTNTPVRAEWSGEIDRQPSGQNRADSMLLENYQILSDSTRIIRSIGNGASRGLYQGNQCIILMDNRHQVVAFNRTAASVIMDMTGNELIKDSSLETFLPQSHKQELKSLLDQALGGVSLHFTSQYQFPNHPDQWYEVNLFPVTGSSGNVDRLVWCMEDIAERKLAQANLKALKINFQSVFKQAAVSVILSNVNQEVIQANSRFYQLIEYTPREFNSLPPLSIVHPRDLPEIKRLLNLLCSGELDSFSLEQRLVTRTGKVIWVFVTTNIIKDSKGKPKLIISVAQDVTDRKHAEQELIFKSNELDTFIYRASHDLRGPVASLMGLYNVVTTEFAEDSKAMKYFEHYHSSVKRLNKILHNLIDLTKIKEKDIQPAEIDLNELISDCLASISNVDNFEKIHFKINNEVDFKLQTDRSSLRTIIFHLLENAVNFMKYDNPQPFVRLGIKYESSFLIIEVTDNGQGIKRELQGEVFNMFYRANENSRGSGLGLYMVRYAVEKLNGSIQLKSKEYSGTKISIYIPYSRAPVPGAIPASTAIAAVNPGQDQAPPNP